MKKIVFLFLFSFIFAKNVYITYKKDYGSIDVYLHNKNLYDITFSYDANYTNLLPIDLLPVEGVVRGKSKYLVTSFMFSGKRYSLKSKYQYSLGDKYAFHNDLYIYRLPCKTNTICRVSQGFNGKFTHKGESKYAVDFSMPVGSQIYACRGGIVVDIKKDSNKRCYSKKCAKYANYITIKHDDGTYSKYAHLKKNGVVVKVGDIVNRGDLIGYSGNTGYTNGPHLHFIVFKAKNAKHRTPIKIKFKSKNKIITYPKRGDRYITTN